MVNASVAAEALLSLLELLLVGLDAHRALLLGAVLAGLRRAAQPSLLAPCRSNNEQSETDRHGTQHGTPNAG